MQAINFYANLIFNKIIGYTNPTIWTILILILILFRKFIVKTFVALIIPNILNIIVFFKTDEFNYYLSFLIKNKKVIGKKQIKCTLCQGRFKKRIS